jgi:hypothetical protein
MGFFAERRSVNMDATNQRMKWIGRLLRRHPVKLTALLYLKEALLEEHYELCSDLIAITKEFGASELEIKNLLEDPRRKPT